MAVAWIRISVANIKQYIREIRRLTCRKSFDFGERKGSLVITSSDMNYFFHLVLVLILMWSFSYITVTFASLQFDVSASYSVFVP